MPGSVVATASAAVAIVAIARWLRERGARRALAHELAKARRKHASFAARDASAAKQRLVEAARVAERTAEQARIDLSVAHEKFAAFMANFPYPAFIQDERGAFVFVNPAGEASAAWRDAAAWRPQDQPTSETVPVAAQGSHYFCIRFPLCIAGKQWLGGIAIDVSERIRAERALAERTAELGTLFEHVPAPLWIARDPQGSEIVGNPAATDLLGLPSSAEAAAARFFRNGIPLATDELPMRAAMRERRTVQAADFEIECDDGARRHLRITAAPLFDAKGNVRGAVAAAADVSQLKAYEAELERAVRRRDEFLAVLAHELRNPLAPVRNSVQILQRVPGEVERVRRATATIDRQTTQMVRLIDALLDVARISQGIVELDLAPRSLEAIVDGALDVVREAVHKTGHEIVVEHGAADAFVVVDALRAEQVLVNVLTNALKYSLPRTRVTVRTWRSGAVACIAVTDEGQGIPAEFLSEIFTMFARPGLDAKSRVKGMGVGLALAKQLAGQQGGSIAVASEGRGRGATFTVSFPLARVPSEEIAA